MKNEMAVMMTDIKALTTAQAADGKGPAHGQVPPEAAQVVKMAENTQELLLTSPVLQSLSREEGDQIRQENALMKNEMEVIMTNMRAFAAAQGADGRGPAQGQTPTEALTTAQETERELLTAQGAVGMGPAHGQLPPEAAQGVRRSQSSQVLSFTRTSADLFGSMADETAEWADGRGPAHGQAPP
jgi:hypothetical protein